MLKRLYIKHLSPTATTSEEPLKRRVHRQSRCKSVDSYKKPWHGIMPRLGLNSLKLSALCLERDTGVGPASLAWEANALPMC